jgi:hypothetical protein
MSLRPALLLLALCACRTELDPDKPETASPLEDRDGDGYSSDEDCDDDDPAINPGAEDICDGVDNDCNGEVDEDQQATFYADADGDGFGDPGVTTTACALPSGYSVLPTDCDDRDAAVNPDADELCNGVDDDCDGEVDEDDATDAPTWYSDADADGYGDQHATIRACEQPSGSTLDGGDCDDRDAAINPSADEVCNGIDDDCDGAIDDDDPSLVDATTWYSDGDGDGWGDPDLPTSACSQPSGSSIDGSDCDDGDPEVSPSATEACNGIDDDCDGSIDEDDAIDAATWYADADADGYGDPDLSTRACSQPSGHSADATDCDDSDAAVNPAAAELCDGIDNDCDGDVDEGDATDAATWYADADADGYGDPDISTRACSQPSGTSSDGTDCDDSDAGVNPAVDELCNGVDDDCDGSTDEGDATDAATWYADSDADGYGDASASTAACSEPSGYSSDDSDCDDGDSAVNPGAHEQCNGVDDDCDGSTDEDDATDAATWYADSDADGYGDPGAASSACSQPSGTSPDGTDCDDADAAVNPGADELCNGVDDDCDGTTDEDDAIDAATWYADDDLDGYGDAGDTTTACSEPSGYTSDAADCDDSDGTVSPSATEICNGVDDDCDGDTDEDAGDATLWYPDDDLDGYGDPAGPPVEACAEPSGHTDDDTDCDDGDDDVNPGATEACNGVDDDCDGSVDEGHDADGDGIADCMELDYAVDFVLTVDDMWEGWVDETYLGSYGGWSTTNTFSYTLDSGPHVLAVYGWDTGAAIAGFLGAVKIDGAVEHLTGDGSWVMVDSTSDPTWYTLAFDDTAWTTPSTCASSSVSHYWGSEPTALTSLGAQWVWHTGCTSLGDSYYRLSFELP